MTPLEAWRLVTARRAKLIDVRTPAEYKFVGAVPGSVNVEWRGADILPTAMFVSGLKNVARFTDPVLLLCRSAVRSHSAARAAAAAGFSHVYNVLEGFEGQRNHEGAAAPSTAGASTDCPGRRTERANPYSPSR